MQPLEVHHDGAGWEGIPKQRCRNGDGPLSGATSLALTRDGTYRRPYPEDLSDLAGT